MSSDKAIDAGYEWRKVQEVKGLNLSAVAGTLGVLFVVKSIGIFVLACRQIILFQCIQDGYQVRFKGLKV